MAEYQESYDLEPPPTVYSDNELEAVIMDHGSPLMWRRILIGKSTDELIEQLGGADRIERKTLQLHFIGARMFGGSWLTVNVGTSHAFHRVWADIAHRNVRIFLTYLCTLAAFYVLKEQHGVKNYYAEWKLVPMWALRSADPVPIAYKLKHYSPHSPKGHPDV